MGILTTAISVLFIITCILLILVVLLQKGRGGGLGAALGGAGSAAFGTKVGDLMTWVTIVLTAMFLLLAIGGAVLFRPEVSQASEPTMLPNDTRPITGEIRVTLTPAMEDDRVYYTTDGSDPTRESDEFTGASIPVVPGMTVKAIAFPPRGEPSEIVPGHYMAPQPMRPQLTPMPNLQTPITEPTKVTVTAGKETDKVFYTTDGSEPTESSKVYGGFVTVGPGMTLKVRAFAEHTDPSEIVSVTYGIKGEVPPTPPANTQPAATQPAATQPAGL